MKRTLTCSIGAALLALSMARLGAQEISGNSAGTPSIVDQQFVNDAISDGAAEVGLARLAVEKASSEQTRSFAQRLLVDHEIATQELRTIAAQRNLVVSAGMGDRLRSSQARLERLSRDQFDRAYKLEVRSAHEAAIAAFRREADYGTDDGLKSWARKTLPILRSHLEMLQGELKTAAR
jgi:putative membrane protein